MSKYKKNYSWTTKNTIPEPPETRLAEVTLDFNGVFTLVTNISEIEFARHYRKWQHYYSSKYLLGGRSFASYMTCRLPYKICMLKEDYEAVKFIDLSNQILEGKKEFAFYNTTEHKFMQFSGSQTWETIEKFTQDFKADDFIKLGIKNDETDDIFSLFEIYRYLVLIRIEENKLTEEDIAFYSDK